MELPALAHLTLVVRRYAEVLSALELRAGEQPLVLPTGDWFPDRFAGDHASFEALVARMQGYAGLENVDVRAELSGEIETASCEAGACGSGACAPSAPSTQTPRLIANGSGFEIQMPARALGHSIAFTASVARMLAEIRLRQAGIGEPRPELAELAGVALGFGVLLLEASHIYAKGCGGPSVARASVLGPGELALPFCLFLAVEGHKLRSARGELALTQRALVDEAWALVGSNRELIQRLRDEPARVQRGGFDLGEARSLLARWFGKKAKPARDTHEEALAALERGEDLEEIAALLAPAPRAPEAHGTRRRDDDVSALVDEALAELREHHAR